MMKRIIVAVAGLALARAEDHEYDYLDEIMREEIPEVSEEERLKGLEESAKRDFGEFDVNGDGQLDAHEIHVKFGGYVNPGDMFHFFTESDKDFSGTVSYTEYVEYIKASVKKEQTEEHP